MKWIPKVSKIEQEIESEKLRLQTQWETSQQAPQSFSTPIETPNQPIIPAWMPPAQNITPQIDMSTPQLEQPFQFQPEEPRQWMAQPIVQNIPQPQPVEVPTVQNLPAVAKPSKERDPLHPFKIDADLPLWAKTLNLVGKPFELIQEYALDPLLAAVHLPFTKKLQGADLQQADKEGILSYFPGGVRHQAYEDLQYAGKWAVEMLPWVIVPAIGAISKIGQGAKLAGAVSKITQSDPLIAKMVGVVQTIEKKLPVQKALTHELRVQQINKAMPALQKGSGEQSLVNFMKALGGTGEKVEWQGIRSLLSKEEINTLSDMIKSSPKVLGFDKAPAINGWKKILDGGTIPFDSELTQLEKIFGTDLVNALVSKRPGNVLNKISDIANAPRAVLSAVDLSGLLRQGAILSARHPLEAMKTVKPMIKAFFADKNAQIVDDVIRARPNTSLAEQMGLYLAPLPSKGGALSKMEEAFMSKYIERIPVIGTAVKASNRAYVSGLNDMRSRIWENALSSWQKLGANITETDYKGLARLINSASGRGSLPKALAGSSPLLNATLFSPRLFLSRLEFPTMMFNSSPLVRKEAARMMVQFLGVGTSVLGMASVLGAKVELDPRSADFAKLKVGNTRLDVWSGYAQWARFMAQLTTEQRKTASGNLTEVNRKEVVDRFFQSKFSPAMGLITDILRGESYSGEEVNLEATNVQRQAYERLFPLFIQDMIDAIDQDGLIGGIVATPGLFGVGVVTYLSPAQKLRDKLAKEKYGMSWEQVAATPNLGLNAQRELERSNPQLLAEIQKEQEDYNKTITGKSDIRNVYRNVTTTIENEYKRKINQAVDEYRTTGSGFNFKEKIIKIADNRRSQYDMVNKDPQFSEIVAKYDELPSASDLKKLSPQDWARKEYMRLLYDDNDMYDQYGNYRFDMVDDMKQLFVQTYGQQMLDYVEEYQNTKEDDMPAEYKEWRTAQRVLKPYWEIATKVEKTFGTTFANSNAGQRLITKLRKAERLKNPQMERYYQMFYSQT